jgi:aquaporin Z
LQQILLKVVRRLSSDQRKFIAEVIGTFIVVVFASGSVVIDAKMHGVLGISFIAFAPFVGVAVGVYMFGKISMAHFNPAVTIGYLITGHIRHTQLVYYFAAEIIGALLASLLSDMLSEVAVANKLSMQNASIQKNTHGEMQ